jgi:hypothetical protein
LESLRDYVNSITLSMSAMSALSRSRRFSGVPRCPLWLVGFALPMSAMSCDDGDLGDSSVFLCVLGGYRFCSPDVVR